MNPPSPVARTVSMSRLARVACVVSSKFSLFADTGLCASKFYQRRNLQIELLQKTVTLRKYYLIGMANGRVEKKQKWD